MRSIDKFHKPIRNAQYILQSDRFQTISSMRVEQTVRKYFETTFEPKGASLSLVKNKVLISKYCNADKPDKQRRVLSLHEPNHSILKNTRSHWNDQDYEYGQYGKCQLLSDMRYTRDISQDKKSIRSTSQQYNTISVDYTSNNNNKLYNKHNQQQSILPKLVNRKIQIKMYK